MMQNQNEQYSHEWMCPISQQLMKDPVIADDGFSYERKQIEKWFQSSSISPITGLHLPTKKLIPNRALKNTIEQFFQKASFQFSNNKHSNKLHQNQNSNKNIHQLKADKKIQTEENIQLKVGSLLDEQVSDQCTLNLQIIPPEKPERQNRKPISLVCILDTSESMNIDAVKDSKDNQSHGFSRLDLVRHSMNTHIQFMNETDELTLISFNTGAQCIMNTTKLNNAGKKLALQRIRDLEGQGTTNIWQGLRVSLEVLKKINHKDKNVFTILLTDGEPNLNPPRGIMPTLKKYIQIEELHIPNFHVFGYGYELDTKLLEDIARKGAGTFVYIPDCSMVGTVFINFMANCLSTITNRAQLSIQLPDGSKVRQIFGFSPQKSNIYNLGCIQYGQPRDILIKIPKKSLKEGNITLSIKYGSTFAEKASLEIPSDLSKTEAFDDSNVRIRFKYLQLLTKCMEYGKKFELALNDIHLFNFELLKLQQNQFVQALVKELKNDNDQNLGQVEKAFIKQEWYKKWGKTYIPSLFLAHLMQVCTNFKDPLLQLYGGEIFRDYQNKMDTIFIKMQPPKPSAKKQTNILYKPAPVDMSFYYRNYGGCIDGQSYVDVWRLNSLGEYQSYRQKLKNVRKGDLIGKHKVKLLCLVETRVYAFVEMVKIDNLIITPWHPVYFNNQWRFPIHILPSQRLFVESYFNFVTQDNKPLEIQNIECISLGHQIQNHPVTKHEYLSTKKVIQDLQSSKENFKNGHVVIRSVQRDEVFQRISKFVVF